MKARWSHENNDTCDGYLSTVHGGQEVKCSTLSNVASIIVILKSQEKLLLLTPRKWYYFFLEKMGFYLREGNR